MPRNRVARPVISPSDYAREIVQACAVNDRMNQRLLEQLDPRAWRAKPSGRGTRTIAAIFAHVHNVRCKWLRLSAPHLKVPTGLDRSRCTPKQAAKALAESARRCCEMLEEALTAPQGKVPSFLRDGWARPWPPGAAMFAYMLSHDAHHRGQICMLAHQLGCRLPAKATAAMWNWEKLWQDCGFQRLDRRKR
jgi:uncharacterized damage-inducible protein DinB